MKTHTAKHKFFVFTLPIILIVLSIHGMSYGQNLNVGEPRTVRMIYFLPNDRPFRQEVVNSMKTAIRDAQTFYAEQMQAHGYGNKTFQFEIDDQGEPLVHRVDGQLPDSHYGYTSGKVAPGQEIIDNHNLSSNIIFIVYDVSGAQFAAGGRTGKTGGAEYGAEMILAGAFLTVVHELGHAFGLHHDWRDGAYVMSYGPGRSNQLSACAAEFLAVHPYFNLDIPIEDGPPPTIELISSPGYSTGSTSVPVRLKVSDPDGIYQVILFAQGGLKLCKRFNGERDATVEFAYDGIISPATDPNRVGTSLSDPLVHSIEVEAVDVNGDIGYTSFELFDTSTRHNRIANLQEHTGWVVSLAFSPDGTILASGSWDRTLKLWDVATQQNIITLEGRRGINSVAFSPDGTILASGADDRVELWDVATRQSINTLEGQRRVSAVAFSPDGTILASGSWDGTLKLWDVATLTNITTLEGHTAISTVAFSSDGTLASGGSDGDRTLKLWDVATLTNITTLGGQGSAVSAVAFSPDGTTLAFGGGFSWINIELLDVATLTNIATLEGHTSNVLSIAYSPDGATLASGSYDSTVRLWDIATRRNIATFSGTGEILSVAFSPDGTILASGADDGTVNLWDAGSILSQETKSANQTVPLPADVNKDGIVNIQDLVLVASSLGQMGENTADVNGDGIVNIQDLVLVAGAFE